MPKSAEAAKQMSGNFNKVVFAPLSGLRRQWGLMLAAMAGREMRSPKPSKGYIKALITCGADAKACFTPLAKRKNGPSGDYLLLRAIYAKQPELIRLLVEAGAQGDIKDYIARPALHVACLYLQNPAVIDLLLAAGADAQARDRMGNLPLHIAAASGHRKMLARLLELGADIDAQNDAGETALMKAVAGGRLSTAEDLLARGAKGLEATQEGDTPLSCLQRKKSVFVKKRVIYDRLIGAIEQAEQARQKAAETAAAQAREAHMADVLSPRSPAGARFRPLTGA